MCVGEWDNNVYVLAAGEALVVDGAAEPERILAEADGLRVLGIVETHGHADHVGAPRTCRCPRRPRAGPRRDRMPVPTEPLAGGETLSVGPVDVQVLHTAGHTPGSLCFLANGYRFSGDTRASRGAGEHPRGTGRHSPRS